MGLSESQRDSRVLFLGKGNHFLEKRVVIKVFACSLMNCDGPGQLLFAN